VIFLVSCKTLREYLADIAPPYLEADWDNSGPQILSGREQVGAVMIGLDPSLDFISTGVEAGADLLLTHHPLIFSRLSKIDRNTLTGKKVCSLIENQLDLIAIHTPMDQSSSGLSQGLADRLELNSTSPLKPAGKANLFKLEVFVPETVKEKVLSALLDAGAGRVGNYSDSYYSSSGQGHFKPLESSDPYTGEKNRAQSTEEVKLEFMVRKKFRTRVVSALERSHPYEEPGFSLYETDRQETGLGLGRLGKWDEERDLGEVKSLVNRTLGVDREEIKTSGKLTEPIKWIGASPGAGGEAIKPARRAGLELLITGELDYHERQEAVETGLTVMEIGHYHSEKVFVPWTRDLLRERFDSDELTIELYEEEDKS